MRKVLQRLKWCVAIAVLLAVSCESSAMREESTSNPKVTVELLFKHDGCTVYRFWDGGYRRYFVKCGDGHARTLVGGQTCGKHCATAPEEIETEETP